MRDTTTSTETTSSDSAAGVEAEANPLRDAAQQTRQRRLFAAAKAWNEQHRDTWVKEFLHLTGNAYAGDCGGVDFLKVRGFQSEKRIVVDGKVGPQTAGAADAKRGPLEELADWVTSALEIVAAVVHPDGILIAPEKSIDGKPLPAGTFVNVIGFNRAGQLKIRAFSGINAEAVVPRASFQPEPGLVMTTDAKGKKVPRDDVFQEYDAPLWDPKTGPQPGDADTQGALGDCYFMASMGAVCGANPGAIKALFNPQTASKKYSVTLHQRMPGDAPMAAVTYSVDTWLPSEVGQKHRQVYANSSSTPSAKNAGNGGSSVGALWVSLLEKAWAIHKGSYEAAAGGWGADAMEALTGVKSTTVDPKGKDGKGGGVIDQFRQMQKDNRAVAVGTKADPKEANVGWTHNKFTKSGDVLAAQLDPSLVFQTVRLADVTGPNTFQGQDDSNNNILQSSGTAKLKSGKVDYQKGTVSLTFDAAAAPTDLQASWSHCGPDYQQYGIIGGHEYRFVGVREPDAINLMNPWGFQHPKPVDASGIPKILDEIASNAVPGAKPGDSKTTPAAAKS